MMRINCAHDDPDTWRRMVENLRQGRTRGRPQVQDPDGPGRPEAAHRPDRPGRSLPAHQATPGRHGRA
ncbi:MAG: hypothetical protein MZW92_78645 [Comamonadaceae bacterium]|nr:hypothetical protein [Comamonadaceae bacterium]